MLPKDSHLCPTSGTGLCWEGRKVGLISLQPLCQEQKAAAAWSVNVIIFWKFGIHLVNKGKMTLSIGINQHTPLLSGMNPARSLHQKN